MNAIDIARAREGERRARLAALTPEVRAHNASSHRIGNVDGVARCIDCEIGSWNAWKADCNA